MLTQACKSMIGQLASFNPALRIIVSAIMMIMKV